MFKQLCAAVLAAFLVVLGLGLATMPANADVTGLSIGAIGYNAYGADTVANRNSEYVDIVNTTDADVSVVGLLLQDSWARGNDRTSGCNTYKVAAGGVPTVGGTRSDSLPARATLRVHMGSGKAYARDGVFHVFRDMDPRCGYHGHVFNNGAGANKLAPWDTVWINLGGASASKSYNFSFGYVAR